MLRENFYILTKNIENIPKILDARGPKIWPSEEQAPQISTPVTPVWS